MLNQGDRVQGLYLGKQYVGTVARVMAAGSNDDVVVQLDSPIAVLSEGDIRESIGLWVAAGTMRVVAPGRSDDDFMQSTIAHMTPYVAGDKVSGLVRGSDYSHPYTGTVVHCMPSPTVGRFAVKVNLDTPIDLLGQTTLSVYIRVNSSGTSTHVGTATIGKAK